MNFDEFENQYEPLLVGLTHMQKIKVLMLVTIRNLKIEYAIQMINNK